MFLHLLFFASGLVFCHFFALTRWIKIDLFVKSKTGEVDRRIGLSTIPRKNKNEKHKNKNKKQKTRNRAYQLQACSPSF